LKLSRELKNWVVEEELSASLASETIDGACGNKEADDDDGEGSNINIPPKSLL